MDVKVEKFTAPIERAGRVSTGGAPSKNDCAHGVSSRGTVPSAKKAPKSETFGRKKAGK